jgi:hypothetical protein
MRKLFSLLLALVMVILFCITAYANTGDFVGTAKTLIYLDEWTLGAEYEEPWEISSYIGSSEDVTVIAQYGVISLATLGNHAFANNSVTSTVRFPDTIEKIGEYAFLSAAALETVVLGTGIKTVGIGAFSGTENLKSVNLEDTSIERLPTFLFLNSGIEEITLPSSCIKIDDSAFVNCGNLSKITIPSGVTEIGADAFKGCDKLVICAPYGSYAIEYAIEHEIPYQYSDMKKVTFLRGDADGDGEITIIDATKIQRVRALYENDSDGMIALRAKSGVEPELSIMDATRIQRKIALYNDPYGIGESVTVYVLNDGTIVDPESFSG